MFLCEQESADTLVNLLGRLLDALHHEIVGVLNIVLQLVCLLNLCSGKLDESLTIERMGLIDSTINEQILSIPVHATSSYESP